VFVDLLFRTISPFVTEPKLVNNPHRLSFGTDLLSLKEAQSKNKVLQQPELLKKVAKLKRMKEKETK
jgi:hypothetical protein